MPAYKYSRQREAIQENLKMRKDHPTADMVYTDIRQVYPNISLGTVYRNLTLLASQNRIRKLVTDDGVLRFDATTAPHNHFICKSCGCILDIDKSADDTPVTFPSGFTGGSISDYQLNFYGTCRKCLETE